MRWRPQSENPQRTPAAIFHVSTLSRTIFPGSALGVVEIASVLHRPRRRKIYSAKAGATIIPAARIEKMMTRFLVASMPIHISTSGTATAAPERRRICGFGNGAVTNSLIFVIDNRRGVGMLVAMSAHILCSAEAANALRFASASALGIWR